MKVVDGETYLDLNDLTALVVGMSEDGTEKQCRDLLRRYADSVAEGMLRECMKSGEAVSVRGDV